ncbi:MAG: lamin tail domain-containing protein, partial [Planctomycetes bacterium]|nr:lamin tail domain-containing protein [Planctomycetota bacterium]
MRPSAARLPAARAVLGCVFVIITLRASAADLDVVVNEVLYHPPPGLEDAEFIELHNRGGDPVDISGWKLSGGAKLTVPSGTTIPAGGYLVLVRDRDLAALLYGGASIVGNYSGRLSRTSGRIRLENRVGVLVDQFDYARSDNWPEDAAGKGASIEKISPELDSWFADSWEASLTLLGSPGKLNTQFHRLVPLEMILPGEEWKYLKGTAEPSAEPGGWAQPAFDDSAWDVGPTGIGYEDGDDATVLDDMVGNYSTVYLRKTFEVADPEKVETLRFVVDYDDGFVLYLNGVEVARRNAGEMPGEPLPYDSLASASREAGTLEEIDLTTDTALLVAGTNALAIHVLNVELDSTDLSMIPALASEVLVSGAETSLNRLVPSTPVPPSSQWLYFEGTEEPSAGPGAWTQLDFGDSLWPEGTAGFGFGDDDDATVLPMQNSYTTVYLRRFFSVPDIQQVRGLTLGVDYDDGFIAYLNGVEVARAGAPGAAGELAPHDAVASLSHEAGTVELFDIAGAIDLLQAGDNVLALQGFNRTIDSSDFSLHPRLTVLTAVEGDPAAVRAGVTVNEIYLPEEETGWIELYNRSSEAADVSGYGISTDPLDPLLHRLPEATILPAGGRLVIQEADLGFTAPASGLLLLTDATGIVLVDGAPYEIRDPALSWGRHPDGEGDIQALAAPTPGEPNEAPPDWGLVINEIMYHPLADPFAEESEWVEIHNASESAVDLTGWAFTGSVAFDLPAAAIIPAGGFVVVARDPAAVEAEYGISGVLGPCGGRLLNDGGTVALRDHLGNVADLVRYASDGRWPAAAGGTGPSAELIHPALDNSSGLAWRASAAAGTPGAANSSFATSAPPIVGSLRHFPLVPDAGQSVTVSLEASGLAPIEEVRIFHRASGAAAFSLDFLRDDGLSGDGEAGDGIFAGALPPQPLGTVVEFYVEVEDAGAMVQVVPPDAPEECNLYLVDGPGERLGAPLYRVIMTPEDRFELESRDVESDVLLNATFVAADRPYYRVGVRYRGRSARFVTPKSYRVEFTRDEDLEGIVHLDLNANRPHHQQLGMRIFRGADVPAPLTRIVRLIFCGDAELTYVRAEDVDEDFLRRTYPEPDGEDGGNLYRGLEDGDLDYRGADEEAYRPSYRKVTNEEQDDWSDLIALCDALANTPDGELETALPLVIDVEEWVRFFAVHTLISTQEEGICRDGGGDYFVYRRPSDGRFVIIPGDLDDSFRVPTERLFRPSLPQIRRILEHPRWAPVYFSHLVDLGGTYLSAERMSDETAALEGLFTSSELASVQDFAANRLVFLDTQISREFTVELRPSTLVAEGAEWRFFRGTHEPSAFPLEWTAIDFDDALWEIGPSGFGYGDNDDATVLDDM